MFGFAHGTCTSFFQECDNSNWINFFHKGLGHVPEGLLKMFLVKFLECFLYYIYRQYTWIIHFTRSALWPAALGLLVTSDTQGSEPKRYPIGERALVRQPIPSFVYHMGLIQILVPSAVTQSTLFTAYLLQITLNKVGKVVMFLY